MQLFKGREMANNYCIIDTNVFITANGRNVPQVASSGTLKCFAFVKSLFTDTTVSVDSNEEIFHEYFQHMNWSGEPGIGDNFVSWLYYNQEDKKVCEKVSIREKLTDNFSAFEKKDELYSIDPGDQKFVAVYLSCGHDNAIYNACDSDWEKEKPILQKHGINVIELLEKDTDANIWRSKEYENGKAD
jgi:hypothetical protein